MNEEKMRFSRSSASGASSANGMSAKHPFPTIPHILPPAEARALQHLALMPMQLTFQLGACSSVMGPYQQTPVI